MGASQFGMGNRYGNGMAGNGMGSKMNGMGGMTGFSGMGQMSQMGQTGQMGQMRQNVGFNGQLGAMGSKPNFPLKAASNGFSSGSYGSVRSPTQNSFGASSSSDFGLPQYQAPQLTNQRPGYMAQLPENPLGW